jgi:hypothetical protein
MARRDFESMKDDAIRETDEKWQGIVAEKDNILAEKDAENEQLRAQLAELRAQLEASK